MAKFSSRDPLPKLKALFLKAREVYYNDAGGRTLMTDAEFDELEDLIREKDPKWTGLKNTGTSVKNKKTKVKLPIPMASLDKVKPDSVDKWLEKLTVNSVVVSDKLDGSSLELGIEKGVPKFLITRGDGVIGGDISFLLPHLKIPQKVGTATCVLRCEGLFSKSAFLKYKNEFDAARNAASGIFNRQDVHKATKDLSIVVLKVLSPAMKPSQGLAWAKAKGFTVVPNSVFPVSRLNATNLTKLLDKRRATSKYAIDGLVIEADSINKVTKDRPDWAKAFKTNVSADDAAVTTIRAVHWEVSHRGQIMPRIEFDPIDFDGAKISFATAFNAKYVNEKGIGVGGKVAILRSGEIIPYIAKVVKAVKPSRPDVSVTGEYKLDARGTNYLLVKPADNENFRIQRILKFMNTIGVDFMKIGTVTKLYGLGFKNIRAFTTMTPQKLMKAGISEATSTKLSSAMDSALKKGVELPTLMDASSTFPHGMGQTRFENIAQAYDLMKLMQAPEEKQRAALAKLSGFGSSTTEAFIKGAPKFLRWLELTQIKIAKPKAVTKKSSKLSGLSVSWTGYRDADQEATVTENGGHVVSFGGKTQVLLVKDGGKASSKVDKAESKGIPVMTWEQFSKKYGV